MIDMCYQMARMHQSNPHKSILESSTIRHMTLPNLLDSCVGLSSHVNVADMG